MSDGEVALPAGVGRVGRGEALEDGEGFAERGQRLVEAALRLPDVADPGMSDGEVALPVGVGRVGRGEALEDGEGFAERGQRLVEPALRLQDVADPVMSDGEVALPVGVGRVGRGEALEDGEGFAERGQRLVQPALGLQGHHREGAACGQSQTDRMRCVRDRRHRGLRPRVGRLLRANGVPSAERAAPPLGPIR